MIGLDELAKFCRGKLEYKQRNNIMKVGLFGYEEARNQKLRTSFGLYQTQKKERQRKVSTTFKSDVPMSDFCFLKANSNYCHNN